MPKASFSASISKLMPSKQKIPYKSVVVRQVYYPVSRFDLLEAAQSMTITRADYGKASQNSYRFHKASASPKAAAKTTVRGSLAPIFERLNQLAQLEQDWDSYGAEPVSPVALVTALKLIFTVKEKLSKELVEPLPSFVAPLADGGLQLEWSNLRGDIEVEIGPDGDFGYVLIEGQGTDRKFQEKHQVSLEEVLNLLSQFLIL